MTTRTLLFTDVVDSTLLVERLGDARAAQLWAAHDRCARDLLAAHHGLEIDRTDGFFLLFDAPVDAARFALAYHRALAALELVARVGLHVGEILLRENAAADIARGAKPVEVEGLAKPFAARVMALANGAQTLLSANARLALGTALVDANAAIESHGHYRLKGVEEPVELFELGLREVSSFAPPPDADKAYRVVRAGELWQPLREVRHNLPAERDGFVGRGVELHALARQLDAGVRLVTVLGPGGIGKTRFVRRYGRTWLGDWPGGVYFCDLGEARSRDAILFATAVALDLQLGKDDLVAQLGHAIAGRGRCLLIFDNFEQVAMHASATLGAWIDRAAEAAFVVTSRERLHLAGETLLPIESLAVAGEAIELFVARARAQQPGFMLTDANRAAIAQVVRLLDGMPLAIELAAARSRVLSPPQLVERMRNRFELLAGARGAMARQATLRAAIDWSWELLAPWEQAALTQSTAFEGGFTLEAAEHVLDLRAWPDAPPVIYAVQALVDKSLLRTWADGRHDLAEPYFGMYLSIREYAVERRETDGAPALLALQQRHGIYFARFGSEGAIDGLASHGEARRRHALRLELDNLAAACRAAAERGDAPVAAATYRAAWEVIEFHGPVSLAIELGAAVLMTAAAAEPRAVALQTHAAALSRAGRGGEAEAALREALATARAGSAPRREAKLLVALAQLHREQGRGDEARLHGEAALALARAAGDRRLEAAAVSCLGVLHGDHGDFAAAQVCLEQALAAYRASGNRSLEGVVLGNLANLLRGQDRTEQARTLYEQALAIHRELGNRRFEGSVLANLGTLHQDQGRIAESLAHYEQASAIHRDVGNRRFEGIVLGNIAVLLHEQGRFDEARAHYEAALAIARSAGPRRAEGSALCNLGDLHRAQGRSGEARVHYEAALAITRESGDRRFEGIVQGNLGVLSREAGAFDAAREHHDAALSIHRRTGERRLEGIVHADIAELLLQQARPDDARVALDAAHTLLREADDRLELLRLLSIEGRVSLMKGDAAAADAALARIEAGAGDADLAPDTELGRAVARLRGQLARNDAARHGSH